jgi:hypothetical protein
MLGYLEKLMPWFLRTDYLYCILESNSDGLEPNEWEYSEQCKT